MIRVATLADFNDIKAMGESFLSASGYKQYSDDKVVDKLILDLITGDQTKGIIIYHPDGGMLLGAALPFPFGKGLMASEIAWWVNPDQRENGVGSELLSAFEYWAREKAGCSFVTMVSLDEAVGKYYERHGYKLCERTYMKEL